MALAAALGAEVCEIYTDVAGVFSADPRHRAERTQAAGGHLRGDARDVGLGRRRAPARARSSTRATTASRSTADRASTTDPVPSSRTRSRPWRRPLVTAVTHSTDGGAHHAHRPAGPAGHRRPRAHRAGRRERERGHDHPERAAQRRPPARTCRSPSRAPTSASRDEALARAQGGARLRRGRSPTTRMGKVSLVGAGMKSHPGVAARDLHGARRGRREHRDDLHLPDQDLLRGARGGRGDRGRASCTRAFELGRRRGPPGGRGRRAPARRCREEAAS